MEIINTVEHDGTPFYSTYGQFHDEKFFSYARQINGEETINHNENNNSIGFHNRINTMGKNYSLDQDQIVSI